MIEHSGRVLIIEPDETRATQYIEWLADTYVTEFAVDGQEALSVLDNSQVDIVLLNDDVPGISGEDIIELIETREHRCEVILLTEQTPDFDLVATGFDAYLTQPLSASQLQSELTRSLLRVEYDEKLNELYTLSETRATIEADSTAEDLDQNSRYQTLTQRIESLEEYLDSVLAEFGNDGFSTAMERTQTVAAERENERRYRSLTEDVLDSSRVGTIIIDGDDEVVWANSRVEKYLGIPQDTLVGQTYSTIISEHYPDIFENEATSKRIQQGLSTNDSVQEFECHVEGRSGTAERWLEHWSKPILVGLYTGGRVEHYYDITVRKRRSQTLETLHSVTRELMQADNAASIMTACLSGMRESVDITHAGFYSWDDTTGELQLAETTAPLPPEHVPETATESDAIWEAFIQRDQVTVTPENAKSTVLQLSDYDRVIALPVGSHGVIVICRESDEEPAEIRIELARLLINNTITALERAEREERLRHRDQQLEEQNAQLRRLDRINTTIRRIDEALVRASDTDEIKEAVCTLLAEVGSYSFVWMGELDRVGDEIAPHSWAGEHEGYLEAVDIGLESSADGRVIDETETVVIDNLADQAGTAPWRREALSRGYRSMLTTPVRYEETVYGVLEVYADQPEAFTTNERTVIEELGETVGYSIHALRQQQALFTDQQTELKLTIDVPDDVLTQLASHIAGHVTVDNILNVDDQQFALFLSLNSDAEAMVQEFAAETPMISDVQTVQRQEQTIKIRCCVQSPTLIETLMRQDAILEQLASDGSRTTITVGLPQSHSVRTFIESFQTLYPDAELVARRQETDETITGQSLYDQIETALTEKQYEALQTAYQAGFFDWPRVNDGEAVAEMLDVSQPTFLQHLRAAEEKVIRYFVDR